MTRLRSRAKLARPYICRLIILILVTLPSTAAELQGRVSPLVTACWSRRMPLAKERSSGWSSASTAAGHHLGEATHVAGQDVQLRAAVLHASQLCLLVVIKGGWAAEQPAGDLAGGRDHRAWGRRGG